MNKHPHPIARWSISLLTLLLVGVIPGFAQQAVPPLTGRVVDQADILTPATENVITMLLAAHEEATSNQVAVLTISSLQGETIEGFSIRVAETWALGTAENDNGVLLLVALNDREMRIEVGHGLEGDLTDALANRIIRGEMRPRFREGDFDAGVLAGVQSIVGTIEGTYTPPETSVEGEPPFWFGLIFLLFPSIFAVIGILSSGCMRWFMFLFLIPFYSVGGFVVTGSGVGMLIILGIYAAVYIGSGFHPKIKAAHKGEKVKIGPFTMTGISSSGSWSSGGGGGWSGGGGFSGGGGSFGGGGSSGGW